MNDPVIRGPVERIDIEIEAAHYEDAAVTGDRVVNQSCAGPCDAKHDGTRPGVD